MIRLKSRFLSPKMELDNQPNIINTTIYSVNKFAEIISIFANSARYQINYGETFSVESITDNNDLQILLKHSKISKDDMGQIWFSTTNSEIMSFVMSQYFGEGGEILDNIDEEMNKKQIFEKTTLSYTTATRKMNELINLGLIIKNKKRLFGKRRTDTFFKLFNKLEYRETTKISNMKFCINKKILNKDNWGDNYV